MRELELRAKFEGEIADSNFARKWNGSLVAGACWWAGAFDGRSGPGLRVEPWLERMGVVTISFAM